MTRWPRIRPQDGFTYLEVIMSAALGCALAAGILFGLTNGMRVVRAMQVRVELLGASQSELEHLRGVPFDELATYALTQPTFTGVVEVTPITARRKQILLRLTSLAEPGQTITLVTHVYRQGHQP